MEVQSPGEIESDPDRDVIQRVLDGQTEEFRQLVSSHQQIIFALIFRQLQCPTTARDLTQETFLRAFRSLDTFRFEASFKTWLHRIAMNVTRSYFSSKRYQQSIRTIEFDQTLHDTVSVEDSDCFDEQAIRRLHALATKLRPKLRDVFVLAALEQRPYKEVSEILSIPLGTVRSRLNTARSIVRKKYFEDC
jgi:RNA polymerase sigma-70 factor (ECF subfamily)